MEELRGAAKILMNMSDPHMKRAKEHQKQRSSIKTSEEQQLSRTTISDPLASIMAFFLQTKERECVKALVDAIQEDCREVGGIIHDGVLVLKQVDELTIPPEKLRQWETAIKVATSLDVELALKQFDVDPHWLTPSPTTITELEPFNAALCKKHKLMTYEEMKDDWEKHAFKVVRSGCYVVDDPVDGSRDVKSDKMLVDSYKHLAYTMVTIKDNGLVSVDGLKSFIMRWVKDPDIRSYQSLVFMPPPQKTPPGAFNLWDGFAVEKETPMDADNDIKVRFILDFIHVLCGRSEGVTKYVLDWLAQLFQQPGKKIGIALLFKGEEGVGKNRLTDLLRAMIGGGSRGTTAKFLQTATPAKSLYGQFTRPREGKILIVINESNGQDNFAANDIIKDMITCDEFQCEAKNVNQYPMNCFARFIFTTNNDNCLKVSADNRRYVIIHASSELRGNTEFFKELSDLIDDASVLRSFFDFLMKRDISNVDWINDRPVTDYMLEMIDANLSYEEEFIKSKILDLNRRGRGLVSVGSTELFTEFVAWLQQNFTMNNTYNTTAKKFGRKVTSVMWCDTRQSGFKGLTKDRVTQGVVYVFDTPLLMNEMAERRWVG